MHIQKRIPKFIARVLNWRKKNETALNFAKWLTWNWNAIKQHFLEDFLLQWTLRCKNIMLQYRFYSGLRWITSLLTFLIRTSYQIWSKCWPNVSPYLMVGPLSSLGKSPILWQIDFDHTAVAISPDTLPACSADHHHWKRLRILSQYSEGVSWFSNQSGSPSSRWRAQDHFILN